MSIHEQARAEAERMAEHVWAAWTGAEGELLRGATIQGFLAGHEAATADDDARIIRLVGVVTATTMLGPQDAETVVRALVAHVATRTRVVTTVTELDALAVGSVVLDRHGHPWLKGTGSWVCASDGGVIEPHEVAPLTVLYEPEEDR